MFKFKSKSQDTAQKEADEKKWRAEVSSSSSSSGEPCRWKPLEDWELQYEPPKPPPSGKPSKTAQAQAYAAGKAKQVLVQKVKTSIQSKIMTIAEETSSKVLAKAEAEATANAQSSQSTAKIGKAWETLSLLLNNINAIVLTFRFERDNATKCRYLRRVACYGVADILHRVFEEMGQRDAEKHIEDLRVKVTASIDSQKSAVKAFVETSLEEALQQALTNATDSATDKYKVAKKKLKAATDGTAFHKTAAAITTEDDINQEEIEQLENSIHNRQEALKDDSISMLSDCIQLLVLKEMDKLTGLLVLVVNKLFDAVTKLYQKTTEKEFHQEQLREEVVRIIETAHSDYKKAVTKGVGTAVNALEAIMSDHDDGHDEKDKAAS